MIILDAFLLKLGALFGGELVSFAAAFGARGTTLMISEERFAIVRPHVHRAGRSFPSGARRDRCAAAVSRRPSRPRILRTLIAPGSRAANLSERVQIKAHPE